MVIMVACAGGEKIICAVYSSGLARVERGRNFSTHSKILEPIVGDKVGCGKRWGMMVPTKPTLTLRDDFHVVVLLLVVIYENRMTRENCTAIIARASRGGYGGQEVASLVYIKRSEEKPKH